MGEERIGDWMQLASGKRFYPFDPRTEEVDIHDIAHALALQCRFGGHCSEFYSVAQHSVLVSFACDPAEALWGLLHDASEAYLCDLPRPIKRHTRLSFYGEAEGDCQHAICRRYGLTYYTRGGRLALPPSVHRADEILLATEARDLMGNGALERWSSLEGIEPLPMRIQPWGWECAERQFLARFRELTEAPR